MLGLLLSFFIAIAQPASANAHSALDSYRVREVSSGQLYSRGFAHAEADRFVELLPASLKRVESKLRREVPRPFKTILVTDLHELRRLLLALGMPSPQNGTRGLAIPARGEIYVRADLLPRSAGEDPVRATLEHELAHLAIHAAGHSVPKWLDEGLAVWVAGGHVGEEEEVHLSMLARAGGLYPFKKLEHRFPGLDVATSLAYVQSYWMVLFLEQSFGVDAPHKLLTEIVAGASVDSALEALTQQTPDQLENRFALWAASQRSVGRFLLGLVASPWVIASCLAIVAILRSLRKRRRGLRRLAAEDAAAGYLASDDLSEDEPSEFDAALPNPVPPASLPSPPTVSPPRTPRPFDNNPDSI